MEFATVDVRVSTVAKADVRGWSFDVRYRRNIATRGFGLNTASDGRALTHYHLRDHQTGASDIESLMFLKCN